MSPIASKQTVRSDLADRDGESPLVIQATGLRSVAFFISAYGDVTHIMITRTLFKSKIHRATVTDADLHYIGSITIDEDLLEAADILPYEKVQIVDIDNGARLETYTIPGPRGQGDICLNGAAARLVSPGDKIIIMSYAQVPEPVPQPWRPTVVHVDEHNRIVSVSDELLPGRYEDLAAVPAQ